MEVDPNVFEIVRKYVLTGDSIEVHVTVRVERGVLRKTLPGPQFFSSVVFSTIITAVIFSRFKTKERSC